MVVLLGPTASGKSSAAMEVLPGLPCEIVSVDSCQVYRGMNIGSAKPSQKDQQLVPHHLLDICDPSERYGVSQFVRDAEQVMNEIHQRGRVPVLVGGTAMFAHRLQLGLAKVPVIDPVIRQQVFSDYSVKGGVALWKELCDSSDQWTERLHSRDLQRIMRALEVYRQTGKHLYDYWLQQEAGSWQYHTIILYPNTRHDLHERASLRIAQMLADGFIDEVIALRDRGDLSLEMPSMRAVGYRQVWHYLDGGISRADLESIILHATMRYMKHQLTWLKRWKDADIVLPDHASSALQSVCKRII